MIIAVVAALMAVACTPDYSEHTLCGVLYTDSTLTATVPNAELTFRETSGANGRCQTDDQGRWAFSYIRHLDNPYQRQDAKFQMEEYFVFVKMGDDTVYWGYVPYGMSVDTVVAYAGFTDSIRWRWK